MNEMAIKNLISQDPWMMGVLKEVRALNLPDCWVGAGFVRSKVWDYLHEKKEATPLPDVDVIYFDKTNLDEAKEKEFEAVLKQKMDLPWSVKNLARMHIVNQDPAYGSTGDGTAHWPETVTAIAARLNEHDAVELLAPYGIEDLVSMVVRISPQFTRDKQIFIDRVEKKKWKEKWPKIKVIYPT